ncbi:MAG: alpha/beta fold hydrolase [Janthinobacterium lividum]
MTAGAATAPGEEPRQGSVRYLLGTAFHGMAFAEWGDADAPVVLCVHGLTRNGRDFDPLARALSDRFRVVCPDLPGRGRSDWLGDAALYEPASYVVALSHLLAALGAPVAWVGTSLGGICGMLVAAAAGTPVTRLVLNDVGPQIPLAAMERIRGYVGEAPAFDDLAALERHLRRVHAPFGTLDDAQWGHLARHSARALPDGRLALHHDPAIAAPILARPAAAVDLRAVWSAVRVPVLAIRGASSDLLTAEVLAGMASDGAQVHVVEGAGHAPALMDSSEIDVVRRFLLAGLQGDAP